MTYTITVFIELLEGRFGGVPAFIAVLVLLFAVLSGFLFVKLRSARKKIQQLAKHLGYEPPYGDGTEVIHEEIRKDIALRGKEEQIKQLEQQLADLEVKSKRDDAALAVLHKHTKEIEDQLQQTFDRNSDLLTQAREQAKNHVAAVELKEMRILNLEAEKNDNENALQRRTTEFEKQLQLASIRNSELTTQVDEQEQTHRIIVEQMEESIRSMEAENSACLVALQQRVGELEDQLQQASILISQLTAKADEQEQAHRSAVEQMEEHLLSMDAENNASLIAQQEALERIAAIEQLKLRVSDLESEKNARESRLNALQAQVKDLEDQLQQAADRSTALNGQVAPDTSKHLLRRAEWVTACAVGSVRTLGLVAAEVYAAAAVAADPQDRDAQHLLFELTKLRGAPQGSSPSVAEAVTAFDDKAADFFGADLAGAAHLAQREALDRYHRGLDRSALLVTNFSLALHKQLAPENLLDTRSLQEMRSSLLERLGRDAT